MNGAFFRRGLVLVLLAAGLAALGAGCIVVPVPANRLGAYSRNDIQVEMVEQLAPGRATREDVLLRLGEPDVSREDGSEYRYYWERVKWDIVWAVGGPYSATGGDIPIYKYHNLVFIFDPMGAVSEHKIDARWSTTDQEGRQVRAR